MSLLPSYSLPSHLPGLMPYNFLCVQAGGILQFSSLSDALDSKTLAGLAVVSVTILLLVILTRRRKTKNEQCTCGWDFIFESLTNCTPQSVCDIHLFCTFVDRRLHVLILAKLFCVLVGISISHSPGVKCFSLFISSKIIHR